MCICLNLNAEHYVEKETDEEEVTLRRKHRRQSSLGVSISEGIQDARRRRASCASSWGPRDADYDPDEMSTRTGRSRPCSWGPIGEFFYRDSLSFCDSERSPMSHHECNFQKKEKCAVLQRNRKNSLQCNCTKNHTQQTRRPIRHFIFGSIYLRLICLKLNLMYKDNITSESSR